MMKFRLVILALAAVTASAAITKPNLSMTPYAQFLSHQPAIDLRTKAKEPAAQAQTGKDARDSSDSLAHQQPVVTPVSTVVGHSIDPFSLCLSFTDEKCIGR